MFFPNTEKPDLGLKEITGIGETNGFKFSYFCVWIKEVVNYPQKSQSVSLLLHT